MLVLFFIVLFVIAILLLSIKLNVKDIKLDNSNSEDIIKNLTVKIELYLLNKIKIASFKINKDKLEFINKLNKDIAFDKSLINRNTLKQIKNSKITVEKFNLDLNIGTEDVLITSALVFSISTILSIFLPHIVEKKNYNYIKYTIMPLYNEKNIFTAELRTIINIKLIKAIQILFEVRKTRKKGNKRI